MIETKICPWSDILRNECSQPHSKLNSNNDWSSNVFKHSLDTMVNIEDLDFDSGRLLFSCITNRDNKNKSDKLYRIIALIMVWMYNSPTIVGNGFVVALMCHCKRPVNWKECSMELVYSVRTHLYVWFTKPLKRRRGRGWRRFHN